MVKIDYRFSHVFDVLRYPTKYNLSKEDLIKNTRSRAVRNFFTNTKVDITNMPDLSNEFDGNPAVLKYMEDTGWARVIVTPDEEISINSNNPKDLLTAARFITNLHPEIDTVVLEVSSGTGWSEHHATLSGAPRNGEGGCAFSTQPRRKSDQASL